MPSWYARRGDEVQGASYGPRKGGQVDGFMEGYANLDRSCVLVNVWDIISRCRGG
ncbi:hypothetical protein [Pasteuria penetrans]|uniref:hypothetical protein n=1 Tax=Pasteuria penetrans TaxID=86005 RepID=UPI00165CD56E|nr:hypothetical protein [Pasteuria penetrans]